MIILQQLCLSFQSVSNMTRLLSAGSTSGVPSCSAMGHLSHEVGLRMRMGLVNKAGEGMLAGLLQEAGKLCQVQGCANTLPHAALGSQQNAVMHAGPVRDAVRRDRHR